MVANDEVTEPRPTGGLRGSLNRRAFLQRSALGAAVIGFAGSVPGLSGLLAAGESEAPAIEGGAAADATELEGDAGAVSEPVVAHVKDLSTGEISLYQGEREVVLHNPALARLLTSAARP